MPSKLNKPGEGIDFPQGMTKFEYSTVQQIIETEKPNSYLEIGSRRGGSLRAFASKLPNGAKIASVELPRQNGRQARREVEKLLQRSYSDLRKAGYEVHEIRGNSQDPEIIASVVNIFKDGLDCLFIDGAHDYYSCASDTHHYSQLVRKQGLVIFHDCGFVKSKHWIEDQEKINSHIFHFNSCHGIFKAFATGRKHILLQEKWGVGIVWK